MTTTHHPRVFTPRRTATVIVLVFALTAILTFSPNSSEVQASALFGGLRGPGDAGFVAGHRGDRTSAPENTMPALQAALDGPMGFVETDIQLSADGVPVLMHDTFVNRTTNGSGRVSELSLAQLKKLDAGAWFSPEFSGTRVPALEELLGAMQLAEQSGLNKKALLELKGFWSASEAQIVVDLIVKYELSTLVVLSSFDTVTLQNVAAVAPGIPRAVITASLPNDPVGFAKLYGAIAIITSQASVAADPWSVDRMHRAGLGVVLYTLNSKAKWREAMKLGVDGIITDRPQRLENWLSSAPR